LRQEIGPELSDDDLLLKILIPGKALKKTEARNPAPVAAAHAPTAGGASPQSMDSPREFRVDVDGDLFTVKILPLGDGARDADGASASDGSKRMPDGAVICGMAGLVLSLEVNVGDRIAQGDRVAVIEAMKMRRPVHSPRSGTVKEIMVKEGEIVDARDPLMVVL